MLLPNEGGASGGGKVTNKVEKKKEKVTNVDDQSYHPV